MVERHAVNVKVLGSSPSRGASNVGENQLRHLTGLISAEVLA